MRAVSLHPDYDPAVHSADPVKEFGVSRSEPIDRGFLFCENRYVEGPYIVERRGLAVYINGILIRQGLEWPPYDETVEEDPGDPPPGLSPLDRTPPGKDRRDDYWNRKWRYLEQRYDFDTAFKKMVRTYRKCKELRRVRTSWRDPGGVTVADKSGRRLPMSYWSRRGWAPVKRDEILARAEKWKGDIEKTLGSSAYKGHNSGGASIVGRGLALPAMEVLLTDASEEEKFKALVKIRFFTPNEKKDREMVREFKYSAELAEKVKRARRGTE